MKKLLILTISLTLTGHAFASKDSSSKPLEGSYPIVLSHGILGFDDSEGLLFGIMKYWGGMDDYLRSQGVSVLTPGKTAMNDLEYRGEEMKVQILQWMAANGYSKVHVIGHSQGGLDSRYMITHQGMSSKVSSLTTLNSVHRGSPVADIALDVIPDWMEPYVAIVLNTLGGLIYSDNDQDVIAMAVSLRTDTLEVFNQTTPNAYGVDYFSYGSKMAWADPIQHPMMVLLYPVTWAGGLVYGQGGANDGIVPLTSQKWGTWKGEPDTNWYTTGVDHLQATNFQYTGENWYDVEGYFLEMAQNAKASQ